MMIPGYDSPTLIGRGGFAQVYRAHQQAFDRQVAVKILLVSLDDPRDRRRFERECAAMGRLTGHPHIVTVLESGVTPDGHPYLTTPYYASGTLSERIAARGPASVDETLATGVALAGALDLAHANGILHRDVKPANVLLSDYGEPALADFGIAVITAERAELSQITHAFTITHAPPEILDGHPATEATDVYSLASTLWTMLSGAPPFGHDDGQGLAARVQRVQHQPVPPLARHDVPAGLEAVLRDALAKDPRSRPTARQLGERLRDVQRDRGGDVTPLRSGGSTGEATGVAAGAIRWADDTVAPGPAPAPPPAAPPPPPPPAARPAPRSIVVDAPVPLPTAAAGPPTAARPDPHARRRRSRAPLVAVTAAIVVLGVVVGAIVAIGRSDDDSTASAPTTTAATAPTSTAAPATEQTVPATTPTTPAPTTAAPPTTRAPSPGGPATAIVGPDAPGRVRDAAASAQDAANALAAGDWDGARRRIPSLAGASDAALAEAWGALDRSTLVLVDWETDGPETTLRLGQVADETAGDGARTSLYCVTWTVRGKEVTAMANQQVVAAPWQTGTGDPAAAAEILADRCTGL